MIQQQNDLCEMNPLQIKDMSITLDITSYVQNMRAQNGFNVSEYKKYSKYVASLMPHLRKISAPSLKTVSNKHPFVFTKQSLAKDDYGMAILEAPLVQLIICESERAYSVSRDLQQFLQSNSPKLQKLNFQDIRRRQTLQLKRVLERNQLLKGVAELKGTTALKIQANYFCNFYSALFSLEQDDYFEALNIFCKCKGLLELLQNCQVEQQCITDLLQDTDTRLQHCLYMATAFAGDDQQLIKEIQGSVKEQVDQAKQEFQQILDQKQENQQKLEILDFFAHHQSKNVELVIPGGAITKKLKHFQSNEILKQNVSTEIEEINKFYQQSEVNFSNIVTCYLPNIFQRPKQLQSNTLVKQFKLITAKINVLKQLQQIAQSYLDKPHPSDISRLQYFSQFIKQELGFFKLFYSKIQITNYQYGLFDGRFSKVTNVDKAAEYLLSKELNLDVVNAKIISKIALNQSQSTDYVRSLIATWYIYQLEQMQKRCLSYKVYENEQEVDFKIDVYYQVPVQQQQQPSQNQKKGQQQQQPVKTETKIDLIKQNQLFVAMSEKVLLQLKHTLQKEFTNKDEVFCKINYNQVVNAGIQVLKIRKSVQPNIETFKVKLAPILPNPVFFDAVAEEVEFDDILFDCQEEKPVEKKEVIQKKIQQEEVKQPVKQEAKPEPQQNIKEEKKKKGGLFGLFGK